MSRVKKPTALKELTGYVQPCRSNPNEPRPTVCMPDRPVWIAEDKTTCVLYDQVAEYVYNMRVATEVDGLALSLLADQLTLYIEMRQQVREEGAIIEIEGSQGQIKKVQHPALPALTTAMGNIHKMLREYGLTAASRSNVSALEEKEVNSFDDFMNL